MVYSSDGRALWASGTDGSGGETITMQDDGNLVIYNGHHSPVWDTHTMQSKSKARPTLKMPPTQKLVSAGNRLMRATLTGMLKSGAAEAGHLRAGDTVHIECDEGYVLSFDSSPVATCGEGGEYDYPTATCLPTCPAHPEVANGDISVTGPTVLGDEVQIVCHTNYELADPLMQTVVCTQSHGYSKPWLKGKGGEDEYSRCLAICPPYPYVDYSTVTVDGSWEKAADPVREGSVVQVTCRDGYESGPFNGGAPTATCVDAGGGKGGVYDPPECSPLGALSPKPRPGYDSCTPAVCIAPPPPPLPPPPPPKVLTAPAPAGADYADPASGFGLNIRCADYRDYAFTWMKSKQIEYLQQCMMQDCVQSLEGGNSNKADQVGCRFTDANGFCYHKGATQMWCKDHAADERCIDGSEAWAIPPLGIGVCMCGCVTSGNRCVHVWVCHYSLVRVCVRACVTPHK